MFSPVAVLGFAAICLAVGEKAPAKDAQRPLKSPQERAKILAACPAYEHYARFSQYVFSQSAHTVAYRVLVHLSPKAPCHSPSSGQQLSAAPLNQTW